jgi:hypothetical protein
MTAQGNFWPTLFGRVIVQGPRLGIGLLATLAGASPARAQEVVGTVDAQVIGAAVAAIDGWLRTSTVPARSSVTYHFDQGLEDFRGAGPAIVRSATGASNRWTGAFDTRTGCPLDGTAPGCPGQSTDPVVSLSDVLQDRTGRFSIQFAVSLPLKAASGAREVQVRLLRLRKQPDGTFVREGGVELLIP